MTRLAYVLFAGVAVLTSAGLSFESAHAQRVSKVTGKALGQMCTNKNSLKICDAYLSGITDSEVWSRDFAVLKQDMAPVAFCVPPQQTMGQIRTTVVSWLKNNPDSFGQPAGKAVYRALHATYPCSASVKTSSSVQERNSK